MNPEVVARPERRSHRWFRTGRGPAVPEAEPLHEIRESGETDERSMRRLELAVAGCALLVVVLLSLAQPSGAGSIQTIEIVAVGGALFISALVSLIR